MNEMLIDLVENLVFPMLIPVLTGVCGWLLNGHRKEEERDRAVEAGLRTLLRAELLEIHARYVPLGSIPLAAMEEVERIYQAYHSLGGNGTGTKIYEEIKVLSTVS